MDKLYRIGKAAQLLGVSASTLRRWEREGKISAERTEHPMPGFTKNSGISQKTL